MGDHKCMNEYYPPDFDPTKLPRLRSIPGQGRDKILEIRTMLPWNIRCNTCGHYMHRGTKFNARVEAATDKPKYLEYVTIRRFYMTCTNCISTITFLTDPEAVDYAMESGATRLFETRRLCATLEQKEKEDEAEEAKKNPMAALEKRTKDSQREMLLLENLAELTEDRKHKKSFTCDVMLKQMEKSAVEKQKLDDEILGKLAQEVLYSTKRLTEEDAKKEETNRKRILDEKPKEIFEFKKKRTVDNKKKMLSGFGGLKVKGKSLKVTLKQAVEFTESAPVKAITEVDNKPATTGLLGLGAYDSDSDSD